MGVPVFFKWLAIRNPKFVRDANEPIDQQHQSGNPPIDNFYVDMNGLIHPSVNPRGQAIKQPSNFDEQCQNVYDYIDKLVNIVRPKRLLYLAVDGVAPRAKMNQQRSRRFRAALDREHLETVQKQVMQQFRTECIDTSQLQNYANKPKFDSNQITPGTQFLSELCNRIRQYIRLRMKNHRLWKNLVVLLSDANLPGQGQHKIMEYIRQQRANPSYDPNQSHCIYGADADLIMLSLATHQPRFYIIRQVVLTAMDKWCTSCGRRGHFFIDCIAATSIQNQAEVAQKQNAISIGTTFQFLKIKTVRQLLHLKYSIVKMRFSYDLQRIIDDFIFMCFFVGNDFLPNVPCLSIRQGGIDVLMRVYEYCLEHMPDYITNCGQINFQNLNFFVNEMKHYERDLIEELVSKETFQKQRDMMQKNNAQAILRNNGLPPPSNLLDYFKQQVQKRIDKQFETMHYSVFGHSLYSYKQKFYTQKFRIKPQDFLQLKANISKCYVQALRWICEYYYKGVTSWGWFYPFHYSPFFTDINIEEIGSFQKGTPFKPFEQLLSVLPPSTSYCLPDVLSNLMKSESSPLSDYFPASFQIDLVGKKFAWQGEVLLPFIDEKRLFRAIKGYQNHLSAHQTQLNATGNINVFYNLYGNFGRSIQNGQNKFEIECASHGIDGTIILSNSLHQNVVEGTFQQPQGRTHVSALKQGITYSILEELDDTFIKRTDTRAYERTLGRRLGLATFPEEMNRNQNNNNHRFNEQRDRNTEHNRQYDHRAHRNYSGRGDSYQQHHNNYRNQSNYNNRQYNNNQHHQRRDHNYVQRQNNYNNDYHHLQQHQQHHRSGQQRHQQSSNHHHNRSYHHHESYNNNNEDQKRQRYRKNMHQDQESLRKLSRSRSRSNE